MKYRQLTREQFESLHEEFARFLASQSIDAKEWKQLKEEKPHIAAEEMNIFSDVVWDDVLTKTAYLEHFSESSINLFKSDKEEIHRIVINVENKEANLLTQEGFEWLLKNATDESVAFFKGTKKYRDERNPEIFDLIEKGSQIAKGAIFEHFNRLIP
ncbi:DUF6495 family protein [Tenacibaculum maritimum]|uniref:DUF6495 family protein n=1 Tax=Tenacibaculum maritimum TaxID=107401 RepID=UPI0023081521|nr:DUF6495 family protein [Tenacibaculum maritimum]MDB0610303.1 DUF6495 family protein [Tenacibaculum maritimum]